MNISGLQKLSLVDFPRKMAATVFTGGCNLRCPFCHNALLVTAPAEEREHYETGEVLDFLASRKGLLDGVVLSGGEPLLQEGTAEFAAAAKALGFAVKLDTNGCFPNRLRALLDAGNIDYVAMATPMSACFRAGASLTPSPVIATRLPRSCQARTMRILCSGETRA